MQQRRRRLVAIIVNQEIGSQAGNSDEQPFSGRKHDQRASAGWLATMVACLRCSVLSA